MAITRIARLPFSSNVLCLVLWAIIEFGRTDYVGVHDGHLRPFGSVGPYFETDETNGFPKTVDFFKRYVNRMRPLKMVGAAKLSNGFRRWTDEYFQSIELAEGYTVSVEFGKKENRNNPVIDMNFQDFVHRYNSTDHYMVDSVPDFIRRDILLPGPLQCRQICEEMLIENIFWMSSGGTASVVHTDSVDNIICLFRGEKQFIMIDPNLYKDDVDLDHPEGAYSGIDVDRVDYTKYPGLASVSYHVINLSAGDCLYIPFKWIHQVRSFSSNIAVNIWWSHEKNKHLDLSQCSNKLDPELTLDKVTFSGFPPITDDIEVLKNHFVDIIRKDMDLNQFIAFFAGETEDNDGSHILPLKQIFQLIDKDRDRRISPREVAQLSEKEWEMVQRQMDRFEVFMEDAMMSKKENGQYLQHDEL